MTTKVKRRLTSILCADVRGYSRLMENDETRTIGTLRQYRAAMDALPPLQRTVLTLYHLDEAPIAEIAVITGLSEGTIKSHLFRSRQRLRACLEARLGVAA